MNAALNLRVPKVMELVSLKNCPKNRKVFDNIYKISKKISLNEYNMKLFLLSGCEVYCISGMLIGSS
jgi:hypothetical protein